MNQNIYNSSIWQNNKISYQNKVNPLIKTYETKLMFEIEALAAFKDNYIWLIKNIETHQCVVIDPGDALPVLHWLEQHTNWHLVDILITHHHADHIGGINSLKVQTNALISAPDNFIIHKDRTLKHNQFINIAGKNTQVIAVPGHTLDHLAFFCPANSIQDQNWLFCGDTLFAAGCGRVREGSMEQMYHSLQLILNLPDNTLIFAAHEYTVSNLNFASIVEPDNQLIQQRLNDSIKLRKQQKNTLPSTLYLEKQTNPFLRCHSPAIKAAAEKHVGHSLSSALAVFNTIREWKNNF